MSRNGTVAPGVTLMLRADKKHAYLSSASQSLGTEQAFKIQGVTASGWHPIQRNLE
jgi:hypothetical protein